MKIDGIGFTGRQVSLAMVTRMPPEERLATGFGLERNQKDLVMAGCSSARMGLALRIVKTTALAIGLCAVPAGSALAQSAAPIVYKMAAPGASPQVRLDNHADSLALNVAPQAPVPRFSNSFGPAPLAAAARTEPLELKAASLPLPQARTAAPYAGPPYQVAGRWYVPAHEPNYDEVGIASWYGPTFHGKAAASGETFDENALTAAHPTLPIPSLVRVTNLENGRSVVVRLNDRGPFVDDRIIDLSKAAGAALDMHAKGTAKVRVQYVGPAPAEGAGVGATVAPAPAAKRIDVVATQLPAIQYPVAQVQAPVQVAMVPASATGKFYLQAGSFADMGNANALRSKLASNGQVSIEAATINGAEFYRVMVGPWPSRDAAEAARNTLSGAGGRYLVVARGR